MSLRPLLICSCLWAPMLHLIRSLWPEGRESPGALSTVVGMPCFSAISIATPKTVSPAPGVNFPCIPSILWQIQGTLWTYYHYSCLLNSKSVKLWWPHPINLSAATSVFSTNLRCSPWEVPGPCGQGSLLTLLWGCSPGHALCLAGLVDTPPKATVFVNERGRPWKAAHMKDAGRNVLTI